MFSKLFFIETQPLNTILRWYVFILFFIDPHYNLQSQIYYGFGNSTLYEIEINETICAYECIASETGQTIEYGDGVTFCPNGNLYSMMGADIFQIDPLTGDEILIFEIPPGPQMEGFACIEDSTFYTIGQDGTLYLYNINSGTVDPIGHTGFFDPQEDLTILNGIYYFPVANGIVQLDIGNPANSDLIISFPFGTYLLLGMTPSSTICNTLIAVNILNDELVTINLADGSIEHLCYIPDGLLYITSYTEFSSQPPCEIYIDLDCNNSSGAMDSDFNSEEFDCLNAPVEIADEDISIRIDAIIEEMTIELTSTLPDDPNEVLFMATGVPNINVTGSGTTMIALTNAGGAKMSDFKDALHNIFYNNTAIYPTAGLRIVEVKFTTASGMTSNTALAFIQVNELPLIQVNLGPDVEICEGETTQFNAGNPGSNYQWSNGQNSQSIITGSEDQYSVTVSNGFECSNQDTVELFLLPVVHVSISGDPIICDNETANLTINTNTPFPLTIEINADPGSSFLFNDVTGDFNFTDLPVEVTEYTITSVTSSQPACIEITNPTFVVEVFPSYIQEQEVSLCEGDSIWLGFFWESDAGVYENLLQTEYGCDSFVTTYITILPTENIFSTSTTCDSSEAGVFVIYLDNPNGCDTVVTTTVTLLPSDTTNINLTSCNFSNTGVSILTLTNQSGCDSLIITTTSWILPADTTMLNQATCDSSLLGVFQQIVPDQAGCDSLIITTVTMALDDTTHIAATSCDTSAIGVFEMLLSNQMGCDSLIITTVSPGTPDTTLLFATSCDSASLGIFETHFITSNGCDSTVISTITYSAQDSVFITSASCDPSDVGLFISQHTNQFGCDSIVTETVSLLPSDATFINSSTCDSSAAGVFTQMLINQFGCDSVVTETVALLPSDETFINSNTCNSSEAGVFITTLANQYGCDSVITETITLIPTDSTLLTFNTCDPAQVGNIETLYIGQDGCDSLVIEATTLFPLPQLQVVSAIDFNGYDISCFGESDGSASALVQGIPPYSYTWSTGATDQTITGLAAGAYQVSVIDGNGCATEGQIILIEPSAFEISFIVSQPDCFGVQEGSITVEPAGGVAPYGYSIDGTNYQASSDFTGLGEGVYQITSLDANDCITSEIIWINVPLMVEVELGDDQVISKGDSFLLQAIVNVPFDSLSSVIWTGIDSIDCPDCLTQLVAPIITTSYSISVTTEDGCADKDSLTLFVHQNDDIYVPNIFSPNGDNINDHLVITAGSDVTEIKAFLIFDRWGNMVFLAEHIQANDPSKSWDGTLKGERMNPAVFTYKIIAAFKDGRREIRYGDITLIK